MKNNYFNVLLVSIALLGCANCSQGPTGPTPPPDTPQCGAACDKLAKMGCEEGKPVPVPVDSVECDAQGVKTTEADGGVSCAVPCKDFCEDLQANSFIWLNPSCILEKVTKCSEIEPLCAPGQ